MVEIYRHALRYYWSVLPLLLGYGALMEALVWLLEPKSATFALVPLFFIYYQFHRHFLFGENQFGWRKPDAGGPPRKFGWFALISLGLLFAPIAIAGALAFKIAPAGWDKDTIVGLMFLLLAPLYLLSYSLFGTALPASVARSGTFRMSSGIKATFGTMGRLILGPGVTGALVLCLALGLDYLVATVSALQSPVGRIAVNILATTAGFFPALLSVAVLCHMYQKITPAAATPQGNPADHP